MDASLTSDGQRFLLAVRPEDNRDLALTLVTNWPTGLNR
jgi:hypothetical protein